MMAYIGLLDVCCVLDNHFSTVHGAIVSIYSHVYERVIEVVVAIYMLSPIWCATRGKDLTQRPESFIGFHTDLHYTVWNFETACMTLYDREMTLLR